MNYAWTCPIPLEKAIAKDGSISGMFSVAGDSMLFVNKYGRRNVNEKLQYNELAQTFFEWDGAKAEYPNLVRIAIWDQRSQQHSASAEYGRLIVPPGTDDRHVIKGATLAELARAIDERMAKYAGAIGGAKLAPDFLPNLQAAIARFNQFAKSGKDLDFQRGERVVEQLFNGDVKAEPGRTNPTMWPLADAGPYYAALVVGRHARHQGRPQDRHARPRARRRATSRSPASTASATALPRPRAAPTGPAARRWGRSSPLPTARRTRRMPRAGAPHEERAAPASPASSRSPRTWPTRSRPASASRRPRARNATASARASRTASAPTFTACSASPPRPAPASPIRSSTSTR